MTVASIHIRAASPTSAGDLEALERIERLGFSADDPWSRRFLESELALPISWIEIAEGPAGPIAYAAWRRGVGEVELLRITVLPEARRCGVGATLLRHGLASPQVASSSESIDRTSLRAHLEVREGNTAARALYEKLNFQVVGRRPDYYQDGEAAMLYARQLPETCD